MMNTTLFYIVLLLTSTNHSWKVLFSLWKIFELIETIALQEEPATLSTLNEGELRALLDEAITYKCPKDREGKSNLFKVLY